MNILVTGSAGFIGSHVCEYFLKQENKVIGVDNFDNFYSVELKKSNMQESQQYDDFQFFEGDICDANIMDSIFANNSIETVIHLAAKAGVRPSIESIQDYYNVNINGTVTLLETMRKYKVTKLIFASSSSIYGNNPKTPFSETDIVDNPISPYASTKKGGELLCHVFHHLYNFDITCLRFFTVFGPRQRPDLAIHKFTKLIIEQQPIPFYGDGSTARDYTYVDDIVNGISCALNHLGGYRIYNIGESNTITLRNLVKTIEENVGKKAIFNKLPMQSGDVSITYADISKAKREIGYNPQVNIEEGIKRFVKWYNYQRNYKTRLII